MEQVTQAASQLGKPHSNEVVPHKISNHDLLVQASIWAGKDVGWLNLNDTQDQLNMKLDLHKVEKVVQSQVELLSGARSTANAAVSQAESAQKAANVNQASIGVMDLAMKATQQTVDDTVRQLDGTNKSVSEINSALSAAKSDIATQSEAVATITNDLSTAKQQIKDAQGNITAVNQTAQSAYAIASDAKSNVVELKTTAQSAYAVATDASSQATQIKLTADSAMALATDANSNAAEAKLTASGISTTVSGLSNQVSSLSDAAKAVSDAMKSKADAGQVDQVVSQLTTSVNQAKDALTSKADKLDVDKLTKTVTDTNDTLTQKANQLSNTITQVSNAAGKNSTAISNLTQTVDGLQTTVKNKADQSMISQLSNQILEKVSNKDYQAEIALLTKDLNLRVSKGDLISQINLEAGGNGLISVQNGKGKLMLDADSVIFGHQAFIPSAAITDIQADKITSGTLDAGMLRVVNLTADSIHGGTLDVGDMHVKNFTADDIETGTISTADIIVPSLKDYDSQVGLNGNRIVWAEAGNNSFGRKKPMATIYNENDGFLEIHSSGIAIGGDGVSYEGGKEGLSSLDFSFPTIPAPGLILNDGVYFDVLGNKTIQVDNSDMVNASLIATTKTFITLGGARGIQAHLDETQHSHLDIQKDNHFGAYFGQGENGNQINFNLGGDGCGFNVNGPLHVTGSKNSIVETKQGYLAINAYETAEYYFGDIGENNTGDTSQVVIGIDRIFNEVVNTDIQYQVFVTPYSNAHVWVEKRYNNRFIVKSDRPNAEFGWELKAKRKGYESNRLRRVNVDFNQMDLKGEN